MALQTSQHQHVFQSFELGGKVAAVTGGMSGIGLEVVRGLAEAGANVAIIYSGTRGAEAKAREVASENNVICKAYKGNVTDPKFIEATIRQIVKDFGRFDVLVANAGIAGHDATEDCTPEQFWTMLKMKLDGAFFSAQAAARIFKQKGHGNVLFTASVSTILINEAQKQALYNASTASLVQLAQSLAIEWAEFCRVTYISPEFFETDMSHMQCSETRAQRGMLEGWLEHGGRCW